MRWWEVITGPVSEWAKAREDRKLRQRELDAALQQTKLDMMQKTSDAEVALSIAQVGSAGWKDEWFTLVFSVPLVCAFIPAMVDYILAGFKVLEQMPVWYKVYLGSAVAAAFGLRTVNKMWEWWHS